MSNSLTPLRQIAGSTWRKLRGPSRSQKILRRLSEQPLNQALENARLQAHQLGCPPTAGITRFARDRLGLSGRNAEDWLAGAAWSWLACMLVIDALKSGRRDEVFELIDEDSLIPFGNMSGTALVGAHLGASTVARIALAKNCPNLLCFTGHERGRVSAADLIVGEYGANRTAALRATLHMRRNGVFYAAFDGRQGTGEQFIDVLGKSVAIRPGLTSIIKAANVPAYPVAALWTPENRIRITRGEKLPHLGDKDSFDNWYKTLAQWYSRIIIHDPRNAQCAGGGLWRKSENGLL